MGVRNGVEQVGEIGSSLKLNNTSPCSIAIVHLDTWALISNPLCVILSIMSPIFALDESKPTMSFDVNNYRS